MEQTVIINFSGGIISPGNLYHILVAAKKARLRFVRFGLRQQLLIDIFSYNLKTFTDELDQMGIIYEVDTDQFPNIVSSYPAEDIFIRNSWLTEGVYKDIFDSINFRPFVKVNICDNNQSFTPMLTGNINWIASSQSAHYWHLIIRFPKTNVVYEWDKLCYTNNIAAMTQQITSIMEANKIDFIDNEEAKGAQLFSLLDTSDFIIKPAESPVSLSTFNLPYYEGLNRYDNKYWLGIYRRDELFGVDFLIKACILCLDTKLGQLCCTSWKTIIIKGINEEHKHYWNSLLEEFEINMRHGQNELNFQLEDHCVEGLALKNYLVKHLSINDTRTFGICFGIKTRKKSEIFSSILIRKRYLINVLGIRLIPVYDILCAKNFNPNERTGFIFSKGNPKSLLPEQLRRAVIKFYQSRLPNLKNELMIKDVPERTKETAQEFLYQCVACFTVYDERFGDLAQGIIAGTNFALLPDTYCCALCESPKNTFKTIKKSALQLLN
jgi:rubredoxin